MNFEQLKQNLLSSQSDSERVEVNQRHLIDKILARYSAEHTIYRELLQNSNDAHASKVTISFITNDKKIISLSYQNNGKPFSATDFTRLTNIAQGNPDEQKIGFFGVGFYSLFSICEEPFVTSGGQTLGFFWKGDSLFTKKGTVPQGQETELTTFWLKCREPLEIPKSSDFARFLATSLAFTTHIKEVEVLVDNNRTQYFLKKVSVPRPLSFQSGDFILKSQNSIFKLETVEIQNIQLDVYLKEEKSSFLGPAKVVETESSLFTRIAFGNLDVNVSKNMEKEMERTTKKKPPKTVKLQIIYSNYDEYTSSDLVKEKTDIFLDILPGPNSQGRIFIGFPTFQTTGCSIQLSTHLIPTVERESIDFVDKTLNVWNQELLSMGGLLARIVAEDDLDSTAKLYSEMKLDATGEEWLQKKGNHNLLSFTFHNSTPSPIVSRIISVSFYKLSSKPIRIVSTKGILPVSSVRLNDPELSNFFKSIPIVPLLTESCCKELIKRLTDNGSLRKVDLEDLFEELSKRPLTSAETVSILQYWISQWRQQKISRSLSDRLRSVMVIAEGNTLILMAPVKYFALPQLVPSDLPIPETVLPLTITKYFIKPELEQALWGLTEYTILNWLDFITKENRFGLDPSFTEKIMGVCSRHYGSLSQQDKRSMSALLSKMSCIVTRLGMKIPSQSYFNSVSLFDDLPTVHWTNPKSISDLFQKAIGVRDHVELQLVFDRLLDLNWNHTQLIKYLTSVQDKLTTVELARLQATPMFPKEVCSENPSSKKERFQAKDLFAPIDSFRSFDLSLLAWDGKWRYNSNEAKFMEKLGLNLSLPLDIFFTLAANSSAKIRMKVLKYFIDNYESYYSSKYRPNEANVPFLPIINDENSLSTPLLCFAEDGSKVLGFKILHRDLKQHFQKFGVRSHPPTKELLQALGANPPTLENAQPVFNYLLSRQHGMENKLIVDFDRDNWLQLRNMKFIPVIKNGKTFWMAPVNVYFGKSEDKMLTDYFTYIDFGVSSNIFLGACGVKDEPTPIELAYMIIQEPDVMLSDRGVENYLALLRQIASNYMSLKQDSKLVSCMKKSAFLIGIKSKDHSNDTDVAYQLALAKDVYLIDDTVIGQLFNVLGAPVESILERMYEDLGSTWISSQVKEIITPIGQMKETFRTRDLQVLIHERAPLLLYDGQHIRNTKDIVPNSDKLLKNLKVMEVDEIEMSRKFMEKVKKQNTGACMLADRESKAFILYICHELDYFDVARALSRIIFKQPRLNDSLLLSTLLSTSLENLRRKGFPVDRILNLKKTMNFVEQLGNHEIQKYAEGSNSSLNAEMEGLDQLSSLFPNMDRTRIKNELQKAYGSDNPLMVAADALAESSLKESENHQVEKQKPQYIRSAANESSGGVFNMLNSIRKNLGFQTDQTETSHDQKSSSSVNDISTSNQYVQNPPNTVNRNITPSMTSSIKSQLSNSISHLSSVDDPRIHAIVPVDPPSSLKNQCQIKIDTDLTLIDTINGLSFYIDKGIESSQRDQIKRDRLERFSLVLRHLAQVFEIDTRSMAIYWDQKGDSIAFNRSRSLFFNAKYYTGLHFPNIKTNSSSYMPGSYIGSNPKNTFLISDEDLNTFFYWFMVFCHELAHNFVSNHDQNHEFWMSSFAEQYMHRLIKMLQTIGKI